MSLLKKFWAIMLGHKKTSLLIIAIILIGGGYYGYQKISGQSTQVSYVTSSVSKDSIISSVSGSGQVSSSNQVDIKTKASGDVYSVKAVVGQEVKANDILAQIDAKEAQKSIRDAQANLESAKLSLEKLSQPADELSILQAENAISQAKETKQNAEDSLKKAYEDGFNTVANAFLNLPTIMTGLEDTIYGYDFVYNQQNFDWYVNQIAYYTIDNKRDKAVSYKDGTVNSYQKAESSYDKNFSDYKAASRASDNATIEALILETYETTKIVADTIKNASNLVDFVKDDLSAKGANIPSTLSAHQSSLNSYTGTTNTYLVNLLSVKNTIETSKQAIINADRSIAEKTASLAELKSGTDPLDLKSQQLSITQKQNSLADALEKLEDYSIRAPFDGMVATVDIEKGDEVSSGAAAITMITKQQVASISLNEVDVAKVKVGQKATLAFDAVSDLTITGSVLEVDLIGTVNQGVTSYNVKIGFDTQDDRIKPGMTVNANIIVESKVDVLTVPNSAIKTQDSGSYVEILENGQPVKKDVTTGLVSDTTTEIISGLSEGDQIITKTVTAAQSSKSSGNTNSSKSSNNSRDQGGPGGGGIMMGF